MAGARDVEKEAVGSRTIRRQRYLRGQLSEFLAAALLIAKGYRIIARRYKTAAGEIDLIAVRRRRLAFVEVKARDNLELAESSISDRQRQRVHKAASLWLARRPAYQDHDMGFDIIFVIGFMRLRHLENSL